MTIVEIAKIAYDIVGAYLEAEHQEKQPNWDELEPDQQASHIDVAQAHATDAGVPIEVGIKNVTKHNIFKTVVKKLLPFLNVE